MLTFAHLPMAVKTSRAARLAKHQRVGQDDVVGEIGARHRRVQAALNQRLELRLALLGDGDLRAELRAHRSHLVLDRSVARVQLGRELILDEGFFELADRRHPAGPGEVVLARRAA